MLIPMLGLLLLPAADAPAATSFAPQVFTVKIEGEQIVATRTVTEQVVAYREQTVVRDGKRFTEKVAVMPPVTRTVKEAGAHKGAAAQKADGTRVEPADLKKKLASPTAVVLSGDGRPVDKAYLALLKED